MDQLIHLSLVNRVCDELSNHLDHSDRDVADFLIFMCEQSSSAADFGQKLAANGAAMPDSFVKSLYPIIQNMKLPTLKTTTKQKTIKTEEQFNNDNNNNSGNNDHSEEKQREIQQVNNDLTNVEAISSNLDRFKKLFPGLSMANRPMKPLESKNAGDSIRGEETSNNNNRDGGRDNATVKQENSASYEEYSPEFRAKNLLLNGVYRARVTSVKPFGFFANVERTHDGIELRLRGGGGGHGHGSGGGDRRNSSSSSSGSSVEGMCHISEIRESRINDVSEAVSRGDVIWVKIISITKGKMALSMKEVDQKTGFDIFPREVYPPGSQPPSAHQRNVGGSGGGWEDELTSGGGNYLLSGLKSNETHSGIALPKEDDSALSSKSLKRKTPYELWEEKQLRSAGPRVKSILAQSKRGASSSSSASSSSLFGSQFGHNDDNDGHEMEEQDEDVLQFEELEENVEIEMNDREPAFLSGQTSRAGVSYSPVRLSRLQNGSMQQAAEAQGELARERREIREQQRAKLAAGNTQDQRLLLDEQLMGMTSIHDDPTSGDFGKFGDAAMDVPEWKKDSLLGIGMKTNDKTIKEQRESLPIYTLRDKLIQSVRDNQILIVVGETGSGKTTQMTQYLAEEGFADLGVIGCTQPRRVAAVSVAKRVAEEFGCNVGQEVGYTIRFEDCTSADTRIKYMTDGMLLREALMDNNMSKYSCIILDEAHERNLHTDVLFGLLKKLVAKRKDLRLIVTSATLDASKFSNYFFKCPIFTIPGRTFPVDILYTKEPESDYLDAALITVMQIHLTEPPGDILLFLTGQEEIDTACQILYERMKELRSGNSIVPELLILPIYSTLPSEMQSKIFQPAPFGSRKVVIGTNIAETSITIDGIYYVVDPGFVKQNCYNAKTGMDQLMVVPISQAAARQRAGRAGRTGPGKCYRLYTEEAFNNEMLLNTVPEIQRTNLGNTVLTLKAMGINDLLGFDFMDPPPPQTLITAMESLYSLGALDEEGLLTRLGRKMAEFPLEPQMSKTLIASVDLKCSDEVLSIVSMLSVQTIFFRPREKQQQADQKKAKFFQPEGDHLTLLAVYQAWKRSNYSNSWCVDNFIQARSMRRAQDVRKQLLQIMDRYKLDVLSCGKDYSRVRKAFTSGYFTNAAHKDPQEGYKTLVDNQPVYIHPASACFQKNPEWVIYHTLVLTTKEYMREVIAIEPKWLVEMAPNFYKSGDPSRLTKRKRQERIEPLFNKYEKKDEWRLSKRRRF